MAGKPAETMLGVGTLGFGIVLLVAAFKNVSPLALIRNAVTDGSLDMSKLPKIGDPSIPGGRRTDPALPPEVLAVAEKIEAGNRASPIVMYLLFLTNKDGTATQRMMWKYRARDEVDTALRAGAITNEEASTIRDYISKVGN